MEGSFGVRLGREAFRSPWNDFAVYRVAGGYCMGPEKEARTLGVTVYPRSANFCKDILEVARIFLIKLIDQ